MANKTLLILPTILCYVINSCSDPSSDQSPSYASKNTAEAKTELIDCNQLPASYTSYNEAIAIIKAASFKITESVNTSKSSWVRGASFYSCDGDVGYFILVTDKQEYIHSGVPLGIWQAFKNADSFGSFYDHNLKHKFRFILN